MTPEIQKLLGGYATGTLTAEEQQVLFEAALHDQALFDALAKEQPLRDLLRDPTARAHVLAAIDDRPRRSWNRWWAIGALAAAAACIIAPGVYWMRPEKRVQLATAQPEARVRDSAIAPQPAPVAVPPKAAAKLVAKKSAPPRAKAQRAETLASVDAVAVNRPEPAAAPAPVAPPPMAGVSGGVMGGFLPEGQQNARSLFYTGSGNSLLPQSGPMQSQGQVQQLQARLKTVASANLGVKWTALRKQDDGLFSEVDPEQIKAGDTIKLRLVANDNGYLSVTEGSKTLVPETRVTQLQPIETPELTGDSGKRELVVTLARQPQQSAKALPQERIVRASDQSEHAMYAVSTGQNRLAPVQVRISLNFQ